MSHKLSFFGLRQNKHEFCELGISLGFCEQNQKANQDKENGIFYLYTSYQYFDVQETEKKQAKLKQKREDVERKARRGEIDPLHEYAFQVISQVRNQM